MNSFEAINKFVNGLNNPEEMIASMRKLGIPEERIQAMYDRYQATQDPANRDKAMAICQAAAIFEQSETYKNFRKRPDTTLVQIVLIERFLDHSGIPTGLIDAQVTVFFQMAMAAAIVMWEDMPLEVPNDNVPNKS